MLNVSSDVLGSERVRLGMHSLQMLMLSKSLVDGTGFAGGQGMQARLQAVVSMCSCTCSAWQLGPAGMHSLVPEPAPVLSAHVPAACCLSGHVCRTR